MYYKINLIINKHIKKSKQNSKTTADTENKLCPKSIITFEKS